MARDGSVTLPFGDGVQVFRLPLGKLFDLQDKINRPRLQILAAAGIENPQPIGPGTMVQMLGRGDLWPHEIRELFRLALIGGGMRPAAAEIELHKHFDKQGLGELSLLAVQILNAAFIDDAPAEKKSQENESEAKPDGSTPDNSTATASSSGSTQEQSTTLPSANFLL